MYMERYRQTYREILYGGTVHIMALRMRPRYVCFISLF